MTRTRIKICCISSLAEAAMAIRAGADALGLVSAMPSGPGIISETLIAQIAATVPPGIDTFLLTSLRDAGAIIEQLRRCGTNTVQICDTLTHGTHADIRQSLPGIKIVQVIHVTGPHSIEEALATQDADALLLDSGNTTAKVKQLGGTGRQHDWTVSRQIVERVSKPVYLAGGLSAENIAAAISAVRPFGVDICSGVRTNGHLDQAKLEAFSRRVHSPFK